MSNNKMGITITEISNGFLVKNQDYDWDYGDDGKKEEVTVYCKDHDEVMEAVNDMFIVIFEME